MSDLTPFVPRLAVELGSMPGSTWSSIDGSMLSADISGFTALSERLAGKGKAGAEEITALINTCFTALIDEAYAYRGEVIKFGGDALLVLFRGERHERRSVNAALSMQQALAASPTARQAKLTMTVGVSQGPFDTFMVGSDYRELLITGEAASSVIHLEGQAGTGETLVSEKIAESLPVWMHERRHAGGVVISGGAIDPPVGPDERDFADGDLARFVPPQVVEQLAAFADLGGEHRIVTVGFVMAGGVADLITRVGTAEAARTLGRLVDDLITASEPFGVTLLHSDIADDGMKFVLCAGAPVNPGDTSDALLQAALEIAAIDTPLTLRQGVQTGRVFAGFLGSPYRRTYTLMGDPVNTAARMLGKAVDRDVVAVASVVHDTRTVFVSEELEPFHVKGKAEPITAHRVRGVTDDVRRGYAAGRLVGRRHELAVLTEAIGELGQVVELVGPAGSGKSRLLDAAWDIAEGLTIFQGSCTPYGSTSPYSLFRPLLRGGLGIDLDADAVTTGVLLRAALGDRAPELFSWLPLLAIPFGASVEATPQSTRIEPEFRRSRIHDVVVAFLDATLTGPVFLVAEDLHWVDEASGELLNHLVRASATRPWAGVLTRRPEGSWKPDDSAHVRTLNLEPLTTSDVRNLVIEASRRALNDSEVDAVVERSGGNPLFAIELAHAVSSGTSGTMPDTVEAVISTRIDELDPATRRLVRIASAFGQQFRRRDLRAIIDHVAPGLQIDLTKIGGIFERRPDSHLGFAHALFRDVAYEGLPYRLRRTLHRAIGDHLEAAAATPEDIAALLSLHFAHAGDRDRTWRYAVLAADHASSQEAPAEAAELYRRALGHRRAGLARSEVAGVLARLGEVLLTAGQFEPAFKAFARARETAEDRRDALRYAIRQGLTRDRQGRYRSALTIMSRVIGRCERIDADLEAEARLGRASVFHRTARHRQCWAEAQQALMLAERADDRNTQAHALHLLHASGSVLGEAEASRHGMAALELYEVVGNAGGAAEMLNNLGVDAYYDARWLEAEQLYRRSLERKAASGDLVGSAVVRMNLAELRIERGVVADTGELLRDAMRNFEAAGFAIGRAYVMTLMGRLGGLEGRFGDAQEQLEAGIRAFRDLGATGHAADAELHLAEVLLGAGAFDDARRVIDAVNDALQRAREQFDVPDRAAAQLALLEGVMAMRDGVDASTWWIRAREHAGAAGAAELVAVCDLFVDGADRFDAAAALELRGIERVPLLELAGRSSAAAAD
jgi:class 3 adenylate cyclase/tetratricopeptide (TPR) repeat protein